jgi:hypothetical protein
MRNILGRAIATLCVAMLLEPAGAHAQTLASGGIARALTNTPAAVAPLSTEHRPPIRDWQWNDASNRLAPGQLTRPRRPRLQPPNHSKGYRDAQRVLAGVALGIVGAFAGGMVSLSLTESCHCGGNGTIWTGIWVGAAAGATTGVLLVR